MMRDLTCFGETSVQIADAASSSSSSGTGAASGRANGKGKGGGGGGGASAAARSRSKVTCLYQAQLAGRPCAVSVTWTRGGGGGLVGRQAAALGVVVAVDCASGDRLCRADVRPWLFSKRSRGSKTLDVAAATTTLGGAGKVDVFWDLSGARFGAGPEPLEGFYVAVVCGLEMVLLLGDMTKEAYRRTGAAAGRPDPDVDDALALLVARREHVVGRKVYSARAQFCHDVVIECDTDTDTDTNTAGAGVVRDRDPCLEICVDRRPVVRVKRLPWKFRGNQTILVDGLPVEVFWDVHGWLFGSVMADAVFMFQTCQPAPEKSVPSAYSQIFREEPQLEGHHGFSLIIHACKVE